MLEHFFHAWSNCQIIAWCLNHNTSIFHCLTVLQCYSYIGFAVGTTQWVVFWADFRISQYFCKIFIAKSKLFYFVRIWNTWLFFLLSHPFRKQGTLHWTSQVLCSEIWPIRSQLLTTIPMLFFCCADASSIASSKTRFMNGSNPLSTPVTCRPPLSFTEREAQWQCFHYLF